jgi:hypothetical protein
MASLHFLTLALAPRAEKFDVPALHVLLNDKAELLRRGTSPIPHMSRGATRGSRAEQGDDKAA